MSKAFVLCGLGWGDESKGATTDKLTRELNADLIVRYGGGSQCAHNVITPEGVHHTFSQFGSGMLANNKVRTHLSRFMLVNPISMMNEAKALEELTDAVWERTTVDRNCVIITPIHKRLNCLREQERGASRHGSCGVGVGVAREFHLKYGEIALLAKDLAYPGRTLDKLHVMNEQLRPEIIELEAKLGLITGVQADPPEYFKTLLEEYSAWPAKLVDGMEPSECLVFEGAQGVLLDEKHGQAPHNTWTNTTFENADTLLDEVGVKDRTRIGCLRTYHTRHGAGPFPTEDNSLDLPEPHNGTGEFQGAFRVGNFDWAMARKAISIVGGIDGLSISHMDYLKRLAWDEGRFLDEIVNIIKVPVVMKAHGPTADHRTIEMGVLAW